MRRCTVATAENAASTAASAASNVCPSTAISTNVPSSGRARRMLTGAASIGGQYPSHALGDMQRRQGRAGDVADVAADLEWAAAALADELRKPAGLAHFAAVRLAVLQDLDTHHAPGGVERHRVVDIEVLADDVIDHEEAEEPVAGLRLPGQAAVFHKAVGRREDEFLSRIDGQILDRVRG